ncbi:MAG: hypothetical protein JWM93_814 [Frankiales bacterium]|nr:hypothetical protein [Frankiales bacterium]
MSTDEDVRARLSALADGVGPEPDDLLGNVHRRHRRLVRRRAVAVSALVTISAVVAVVTVNAGINRDTRPPAVTAVTAVATTPATPDATTAPPPEPTVATDGQLAASYPDIAGFRGGQQIVLRSIASSQTLHVIEVPSEWHVWSVDAAGEFLYALVSRVTDLTDFESGGYAANTARLLRSPIDGDELLVVGPAVSVAPRQTPFLFGWDSPRGRLLAVRPDGGAAVIPAGAGYVLVDLASPNGAVTDRRDSGLAGVFGWGPGPDDVLAEPLEGYGETWDHVVRVIDVRTGASSELAGVPGKVCAPMTAAGAVIAWTNCLDGGGTLVRIDETGAHQIAPMTDSGVPPYATAIRVSADGLTARVASNVDCDIDEWTIDLLTGLATVRVGDGEDSACGAAPPVRHLPL